MSRVSILGGGSWGTALAQHAAGRFETVQLWVHDPELEATMRSRRENPTYLPGIRLAANVRTTRDPVGAVRGAGMVLLAVPSQHLREVGAACSAGLGPDVPLVVATKGIEAGTLCRMSQVASEATGAPAGRVASLSGPSFAREVASGHPTAVVVGTPEEELGQRLQVQLTSGCLRAYRNADQVGVELGGALKNVIAVAAGIVEGLGLGSNTLAALLTRGLHEITRLAVALGAERSTLAGLAGMGDLVLTCTGALSRNRSVGIELGRGRALEEILDRMKMVAEGVRTAPAAVALSRREGIEMPITERVNAVLFEGLAPREAIHDLLDRALKDERAL